jgi:hypothetical protein
LAATNMWLETGIQTVGRTSCSTIDGNARTVRHKLPSGAGQAIRKLEKHLLLNIFFVIRSLNNNDVD